VLEKSSGGKRKGRSPMEMGWQDSCGKCRRRSPMEMCWRRGQPAQGLHYLSSVESTTSPIAVRDEYYRQQGAHVFEGEVFWD